MTILITVLYATIYGIPFLMVAIFVLSIFRRTKHLKSTENLFGFLIISSFFIAIPPVVYLSNIFLAGKGFIGYYLSLPNVLNRYVIESKSGLIFFSFHLVSTHILAIIPLLAILRLVSTRNKFYKVISDAYANTTYTNKNEFEELKSLIQIVKKDTGIRDKVEIRIIENIKAHKVIGSSNLAVIKHKDFILLILSRKFLELFSRGVISKDEVKAILYHEFGHIINKDHIIPVSCKAILNRPFLLLMYFSFSIYLATIGKSMLLYRPEITLQFPLSSVSLTFFLAFFISCLFVGLGMYYISLFHQKSEILADNLAIQYVPSKDLMNAIIKVSIVSEADNSGVLSFSSDAIPSPMRRKQNFLNNLWNVLKNLDIFTKHNKLFYYPSLSQRIKVLSNPSIIIEEENTGLLNFETFGSVGVFSMGTVGFGVFLLNTFIHNENWRDVIWVFYTYTMQFWLVLLTCFPLRYKKNLFIFNRKSIKLIVIYSVFISIFSRFPPLVLWWVFLTKNLDGEKDWMVKMIIKSQISNSISKLTDGFIFSLVLFGVFLIIGNIIIERKMKKLPK